MAKGDGDNFGQAGAAQSVAASDSKSRQKETYSKKPTLISLPNTNNSYFYSEEDRTPPKDTRGRDKSRHTMAKGKGETNKNQRRSSF